MPPTYYYNAKNNNVEEILVPNLPLGGIEGEKSMESKKTLKGRCRSNDLGWSTRVTK